MRIRCSFTLEPEQQESHRQAVATLKQWQQREKSQGGDSETQLGRRNAFHRDLYLSGLFLHLLSPQLPTHLAKRLGEPGAEEALKQCLSAAGVDCGGQGALADNQWQRLTSMLKTAMAAPKADSQPDLQPLQQQLERVESRIDSLQPPQAQPQAQADTDLAQIEAQLAQLQQGQAQLLAKLDALPQEQGADLSAPLQQLKQGQDKLLNQVKSLKGQLGQAGAAEPATEVPDLESQLAKASRVKAKGIW